MLFLIARRQELRLLKRISKPSMGCPGIGLLLPWIYNVKRWEDANVIQVEGICVDPAERDKGLATRLYEALVLQCGVTLVSDFEQYEGGKMLWQKIARESDQIAVFVLDTEQGAFWPYDGSKVIYDGGCIPEDRIWSHSPDQKCYGIVLVAENKQRANQLMEVPGHN